MFKGLHTAGVSLALGLLFSPSAAQAQETLTLNRADYTTPAWTALRRAVGTAASARQPFSINTTVNGDPTRRLAFAWFTNAGATEGRVQLVAKAGATAADFTTAATEIAAEATATPALNYSTEKNKLTGVAPGEKISYVSHKALAESLMPGTDYSFRVGTDGAWSEIGHFRTAATAYPTSGYNFIYITDTQAQNDEMFAVSAKTVHTARAMVPDAAFCLVNGDLVETSGANNSEWENEQWFSTMQDVWLSLPLVPIQGNHDTSANQNWAWHFNTDRTFSTTSAVPTAMPGTVYSFVQGPVLFLAINYEDYAREGYFKALAQWMRSEVAKHPEVKWRVATFHKNMFTGSQSHQSDNDGRLVREAMLPVFDELKIDVALQGHDHIYEVIGPVSLKDKTLVADGISGVERVEPAGVRENMTGRQGGTFNVAKGTLFFLNNSAGKKKYEPRDEAQMSAAYSKHEVENYWGLFSGKFGQTGEPTFSRVNVTDDVLTFDTYTVADNGAATLFDSFRVVKNVEQPSAVNTIKAAEPRIYYDAAKGQVCVEGATPERLEVFTADGKSVAADSLTAGLYIVRATVGGTVYTAKIRL